MGFFDWFRPKGIASGGSAHKGISPRQPAQRRPEPSSTSPGSVVDFAGQACRSATSFLVRMNEFSDVVDALTDSIRREYPNLESGEAFSHAQAGMTLYCPLCGELAHNVVSYLYIAGSGGFGAGQTVFGGPNVAALAQGHCPRCGGTSVIVKFDPQQVKARSAALSTAVVEAAHGRGLTPSRSAPYLASLTVSPNQGRAAWVAGERSGGFDIAVVSMPSGTPVTTIQCHGGEHPPQCLFVGDDRLLIAHHKTGDVKQVHLRLCDVDSGAEITSIDVADGFFSYPAVRHETRTIVAERSTFSLLVLQADQDRLAYDVVETSQLYRPGPRFGPDGHIYVIIHYALCRLDNGHMVRVMPADHCICVDPAGIIYCGSGHADRSGESAIHALHLSSGKTSEIPWGREPIDVIAIAGHDRLLVANEVNEIHVGRYPDAVVTLVSVNDQRTLWTRRISDLRPWRSPVLLSAPAERWALIQTGRQFQRIALANGEVIETIAKQPDELASAAWFESGRTLCLARKPRRDAPGLIESYQID